PWSRVAEAFRSFRTAVLFSVPEAPPKVILVTSTRAAEGKTVGSINLATALAQAGSRVLLLDADLRHPRCHCLLGVDAARGLSSFLAGKVELESVLQTLDAPPLSFIPAGPLPVAPAELVGSARMRQALTDLRGQYDFVIVDTPPVLPVTDAVVLATKADAVAERRTRRGSQRPPAWLHSRRRGRCRCPRRGSAGSRPPRAASTPRCSPAGPAPAAGRSGGRSPSTPTRRGPRSAGSRSGSEPSPSASSIPGAARTTKETRVAWSSRDSCSR